MTSRKGNGNAISQPNSIADWNSGPEESAHTVNASLYAAGSIQILTESLGLNHFKRVSN